MNKTAKKIGGITLSAVMAMSLALTAAPATTVSAATTCTVYFDNSDNWDEVYVYFTTDAVAWSDAGFTDSPITDSNGDGWYEFEISTDTDAYVIFTTSNGGWEAQTCNIFIPAGTTEGWAAYADYENGSDPLDISTTAPEGFSSSGDEEETASEEAAESSEEEETSETTEASEEGASEEETAEENNSEEDTDTDSSSEESGTSTVTETTDVSVSPDSSDITSTGTTETGDAAPIAAAAVALLGCAAIVFASKRKTV